MQLIIDLDLQEVIQDFGLRQAVLGEQCKSQDTPRLDIYFAQSSNNVDLGSSPGLRFGVFTTGNPNSLCTQPSFTRNLDLNNNVRYSGFPNFDTAAMAAVLGSSAQVSVVGEVRYQVSDGTIARTMDIPVTVIRSLLAETILDTTQAAFTVPAVASNVTIQISNTGWLHAGLNLTIGNGAGAYQVVSITDSTHFVAENQGGSSNAAPGTVIPSGTTLGIAPAPVLPTYPDASTIELTTHKGVANGYPSLDGSTLIPAAQIPVDTQTINVSGGKIASSAILASVAANFITPAAEANVTITLSSTASLVVGQFVRIPIAGYYSVESITDGTHAVFENVGDPFNAIAGVTITTGAVLLPAQAAGGGGSAGQNAFTQTTAAFTVPAIGSTVSAAVQNTAWLGGVGYYVFITGAGYYAVNSITDSTHVVLTNAGGASNAIAGSNVASGASVAAAGSPGSVGTIGAVGLAAYDALATSFVMPAAAATVNISIANTAWVGLNQILYVAGGGYVQVTNILSATQLTVSNLNYPGNALAGATVASGAKVSPGGYQGAQGAGGAGLNAFTTLTSSFTQPAINNTVTIVVGTTAWIATGQGIFVTGGGYYTVSAIVDLTHVTVTNLGSTGNAAPGATVTGSGTQVISPAGVPGTATAAFTTTTASFVMPAALQSVTISVASSSALQQNQNIYIGTAGYFSVSSVTDGTHIIAVNLGSPGNINSGTTISSGVGVTPAGATGPAINTSGGFSTAADAIAPAGTGEVSEIAAVSGGVLSLKKLKSGTTGSVALTDNGGTTGDVLIDVPVDGTTITVVSGKLTASGGGGGSTPIYPSARIFDFDDFDGYITSQNAPNGKLGWYCHSVAGGTTVSSSNQGANSTDKAKGVWTFTGSTTGDYAAISLGDFTAAAGAKPTMTPGLGILQLEFRINIGALPTGTQDLLIALGLCNNAAAITTGTPNDGVQFFYWFGNAITNWRCSTIAGGTATNTSSGIAATAGSGQWHKFQILTNAGWTSIQFKIDGTVVATNTTNIPTANLCPFLRVGNGSTGTWAHAVYADYYYHDYQYTR